MSILSGVSSFFGLDIGNTGIRVVELHGSGATRSLVKYAYVPIDTKLILSDAQADRQKVAQVIKDLLSQAKLSSSNAAVGLASNKVFISVIDFDKVPESEMGRAIAYQADSLIPTPIAESKLDWAILGDSPTDPTKAEVLISSVPNGVIEKQLDLLESIGVNVIAFEPDSMALVRALLPPDNTASQLVVDIGQISSDIVAVKDGAPRLARSIPMGLESVYKAAKQNLKVDEDQAIQFVNKFGIIKDKLEGQVYQAVIGTVDQLVAEVDKSIKFFQTRYSGAKIERVIVTGGASSVPELPLYMANKLGVQVEIGNAWKNVSFANSRQNELLAVSNHFGVAAGLAERNI
ncbi:type IV pilus assembly protein PilM [Candidatus Saccharibacteria bacterium]|nr:type IV pilus assembly protein PilM [Candidatus Saccharibacteria bacterium]